MPLVIKRHTLLVMVALLALVALACERSGEIITDAEATQRSLPTEVVFVDLSENAKFQIGETASTFGGTEFGAIVPLYGEPGGRFFTSQVLNNTLVVIIELGLDEDGNIWYKVEGNAGQGWVADKNLVEAVEDLGVDLAE